ncbi:Ferredoxin--sulfite reductase [hydrothermal vent metagenome]|uniref:Ferredoxin--sulfite reductase n=1 Tax=hydrothermal vent metagenome TaxID=652676 RepID=A0A3B0UK53_9ZZZZ
MYILPLALKQEIGRYNDLIKAYQSKEIDPKEFKAFRVPMGIYEQRKDGTYMVRVRCSAGYIAPVQLKRIAEIAQKYSSQLIHITTRQELQIQNLALKDTYPILQELYAIGLASRGGGGNTVRNIMASVDAGISKDEVFDVTPYNIALTNYLIAQPDSWTLPRKYKITFSGSDNDNAFAAFNDLGFIARIKEGQKGFKVYIGGSLGSKPMVGHVLFDFLPAEDILYVADAVKELFSRYGNRRNKHKARLRFVFYRLGKEKVFEIFKQIYDALKQANQLALNLPLLPESSTINLPVEAPVDKTAFALWQKRYVTQQKQTGYISILVPFEYGDVKSDVIKNLGEFLIPFGEDVVRFSMRQNIHLRNIPKQYAATVFNFLQKTGVDTAQSYILNALVSCTGANTCRLGICLSKGALGRLRKKLASSGLDLDQLKEIRINVSGCPNSCGQQTNADIGFYGKVGRTDRMFPAYHVVAGAVIGNGSPQLAEPVGSVSARDMPDLTIDILRGYLNNKGANDSFSDYYKAGGSEEIKKLCLKYSNIPDFEDDKNYYFDWGSDQIFSLAGKGAGECSAGLFDMIDVDYNTIRQSRDEIKEATDDNNISSLLAKIVTASSRMLLITKGIEPKDRAGIFDGFTERFIKAGLVSEKYSAIVNTVKNVDYTDLSSQKNLVFDLAADVIDLYENMDDSLQFPAEKEMEQSKEEITNKVTVRKDLRGVACPMNFVMTKIELAKLKSDDVLEVLLDDGEPIENVPGSVKGEGHKILVQERIGNYWSVVVQKR